MSPLRRLPPLVVAADLLALLVFVVTGMRSHHQAGVLATFLRNAVPLTACWVIAAALLGTYRASSLGMLLRTWIVAVPIALVVRSLWVGSPSGMGPFLTFLGVGLAFTLLFLLIGRGLVTLLTGQGYPRTGPRP